MNMVRLNNDWCFVNETWRHSYSWGHKSTLLYKGKPINEAKMRYYNRTWEKYKYQSCMLKCLQELIEQYKEEFTEQFKENNGFDRLSEQRRRTLEAQFRELEDIKLYDKFYNYINYDWKGEC